DAKDRFKGKHVVIQGAGLSASDAAVAAFEIGGAEKVTILSRHGKMRELRGNTSAYTPRHLTIENLEARARAAGVTERDESGRIRFRLQDVIDLGRKEMQDIYTRSGQADRITPQAIADAIAPDNPQAYLQERIREIDEGKELPWRSVLNSLAPVR